MGFLVFLLGGIWWGVYHYPIATTVPHATQRMNVHCTNLFIGLGLQGTIDRFRFRIVSALDSFHMLEIHSSAVQVGYQGFLLKM